MLSTFLPFITELLPKPSTGTEWIEIYNPAETSINLEGWSVWDQLSQPSLLYTFADFSLAPQTTVLVEVTKKLNDSGDGVVLYNELNEKVDTVTYTNAKTDLSYSLTGENSYEWQTPSPNFFEPPTIPSIDPTPTSVDSPTTIPSPSPGQTPTGPTTPRPSPTRQPTPTPLLRIPTPTKTPTPSSTPKSTPTPSTTTQLIIHPTLSQESVLLSDTPIPLSQKISQLVNTQPTPLLSSPTKPLLSASNSANLALQGTAAAKNQLSLSPKPTKVPRSQLVFFTTQKNPLAAIDVIIGGQIIAGFYGWLLWWRWKNRSNSSPP